MTKHPFYNPTPHLVRELFKGLIKLCIFIGATVAIGFGFKMVINAYPQIAAFTHIYEYTNIFQASILSFLLLMTYFVAYGLPILLAIYFIWVLIRETYLMFRPEPNKPLKRSR